MCALYRCDARFRSLADVFRACSKTVYQRAVTIMSEQSVRRASVHVCAWPHRCVCHGHTHTHTHAPMHARTRTTASILAQPYIRILSLAHSRIVAYRRLLSTRSNGATNVWKRKRATMITMMMKSLWERPKRRVQFHQSSESCPRQLLLARL